MAVSTPISSPSLRPAPLDPCSSRSAAAADADLWIFRDGRKSVSGPAMLSDLMSQLANRKPGTLADCLIQAGELECGVADLEDSSASCCKELTDTLATELVSCETATDPLDIARRVRVPETVNIAPPEGFSYYALHPLDFAHVVHRIPQGPAACALIGIRSIGTTLSAVATAALKKIGRAAERITVRPIGHPYQRNVEFSSCQLEWIRFQLSIPAQFLVIDEGPGRSGSTFLSVAEALVRAGVASDAITMIGTRPFDPAELCADNAAERWRQFHFLSTIPSGNSRFADCVYAGGGEWRSLLFPSPSLWPPAWPQMERLKFLSSARRTLFKFEGMGPSGAEVRERALILSDSGFAPPVQEAGDGFLAYQFVTGRPMQESDLSAAVLDSFARYCAFRAVEFVTGTSVHSELRAMLEHNLRQEFGDGEAALNTSDLNTDELVPERAVIADGCMQPYEWIVTAEGKLFKTDAVSHGDNHFFPGPCDITWDLAGAAVEWGLDKNSIDFLLGRFQNYSGIDPAKKMAIHILVYSIFRLGCCKMAASTVRGTDEEGRCQAAYLRYRAQLQEMFRNGTGRDGNTGFTRLPAQVQGG